MTQPHERLNRGTRAGADKASAHLDALTRAYGRALRAAGRRAAAAFRRTETVTAAANPDQPPGWVVPPTGSILDQTELAADTQRKTAKLHRLMLTASAGAALDPFGISFDINAPTSQALLDAVAQRIQAGIASAIQEQIIEAIKDGYDTGKSVAQVARAIEAAADAISRARAEMLARTDLNALSNGGSLLAATVSGAAATKTWLATEDERTRETHSDADGQTVAIDAPFSVGGEDAMYPGDPGLSDDEACNCRCSLTYGEPLTASAAGARPRDFASWADHAWGGDSGGRVASSPTIAVTSGGTMSDLLLDTAFAATGDTELPLSERDRAWDAGEATGRVKKWASSDGTGAPDKIDYPKLGRAYFWQDKPGESGPKLGDFHLPFADIIGGKLTAVWRGVTAGAQRLSQTQGIDAAAVEKKMGAYYAAAAAKFGDPSIKPPWATGSHAADGEALAAHRAFLADHGADVLDEDELRAYALLHERLTTLAMTGKHAYAGTGGPCAICGMAASNKDIHFAAAAALEAAALLAAVRGGTPWTATLCVEGEPTVDNGVKRLLAEGSIDHLPLPLPLMLMDDGPHADVITKAPICGRIDLIWKAGSLWQASGVCFDDSDDPQVQEVGAKAAALITEMRRLGISVDLVDAEWEVMVFTDGGVSSMDEMFDEANDPTASNDLPGGPATQADVSSDISDDAPVGVPDELELMKVCVSASIAGATIVPVAALAPTAVISVVASGWFEEPALTAAAAGLAPLEPPLAWFEEPEHPGPTALTVTDDGQVYGHLALWGTCHTGKPGACVTPPHSPTGYSAFHRGELKTAEGDRIGVGVLTMNTGHAGLRMNAEATVAHYDDTGTQAAHVRASDGEYGIWLAGAVNPKLAAEDVRLLMASPPSGDWRNIGDGLDLFAALAVNGPGFPVPRARLVASGAEEPETVALVAAGRVEVGCAPCEESFQRELLVLAASADGIAGLAALVEA